MKEKKSLNKTKPKAIKSKTKVKEDKTIKKLENKIEEFENNIKEVTQDRDSFKEKNIRLLAEFDNYKRRTLNEKSDILKYGSQKLVKDILSVMDDLQRTTESSKNSKNTKKLITGINLVKDKFEQILTKNEICSFQSIGEKFDANLHDALMNKETDEADGIILEEFEKGYKFHDKIIRHAKVVVNKAVVKK